MPTQETWRKAFAQQSLSDLKAYQHLCKAAGLAHCHRLHYLQMHLEKLCKARLYEQQLDTESLRKLQSTHRVIAKVMPQIVREYWREAKITGFADSAHLRRIRNICRELDFLHPAVDDDGRRPDNVEYPWPSRSAQRMEIPAGFCFKVEQRLGNSDGRTLLKVAALAASILASR